MNYTFNDPSPQWINQQQLYLDQSAIMPEREECELMQNQLFNEFSSGIKQEELSSNNGHFGMSTSSTSSPSAILNNVPLSNSELDHLNNSIQNSADNEKLSEEELADRRKAQNRAAQRAFRERKEMKLKDLRDQLDKSETDKAKLLKELEELKKQNIVISTENKLLLENNSSSRLVSSEQETFTTNFHPKPNENFTFPDKSKQTAIEQEKYFLTSHQLTDPRIPYEYKRLTIPEVWDYINQKSEEESLDFEINEIMENIKGLEVCHERGPAYPLVLIDQMLQNGGNLQ